MKGNSESSISIFSMLMIGNTVIAVFFHYAGDGRKCGDWIGVMAGLFLNIHDCAILVAIGAVARRWEWSSSDVTALN